VTDAGRILTTVVGSYPVPDWLVACPSEQALIDVTRVMLHTQERAGVDLLCDGELYRFAVNHPETNGMIDYFVRPLDDRLDRRGGLVVPPGPASSPESNRPRECERHHCDVR
jgi:hypothetical protein